MYVNFWSCRNMSAYLLIFIIGFFCSILGSAGGGSALISIPLLTIMGLPPSHAIATAKVWALGTLLSGFYSFARAGKVDKKIGIFCAIFGLLGSIVGGCVLLNIDQSLLEWIFGIGTLVIIIVMMLRKKISATKLHTPEMLIKWKYVFGYISFFFIGIWWGLLAGQAIIATIVLVEFFGKSFTTASGTRKLTGLAIAFWSLAVYLYWGVIRWDYGIIMLSGTLLGGYVWSEFSLKKWEKFIEAVFYIVAITLSIQSVLQLF